MNNDDVDNNNVDYNKLKEEDRSLQNGVNGHCHVEMENEEEDDMLSDLPVNGRFHELSHNKTSTGELQ